MYAPATIMTATTISTIVIISKSVTILPDCCDAELNGPIWKEPMKISLTSPQSSAYQSSSHPG